MKVEKSISMHLHTFKQPYKRQIVTDTKSCNASQIQNSYDQKVPIKMNELQPDHSYGLSYDETLFVKDCLFLFKAG